MSEYPFTELIYSDIENIHVMRSSFQSLLNVNLPKDVISMLSQTSVSTTTARFMPPAAPVDGASAKDDSSHEVVIHMAGEPIWRVQLHAFMPQLCFIVWLYDPPIL